MKKVTEKERYALGTYVPTKNAKQIKYNNVVYASKKQCMVLNDLTRKELDEAIVNGTAIVL